MATVPTGGRRRWPVGGSLNYNTVLQLDTFCGKQGLWVEVAYLSLFFLSAVYAIHMPQAYRFGYETFSSLLSSYFPKYTGLQTEETESQRTSPLTPALLDFSKNQN